MSVSAPSLRCVFVPYIADPVVETILTRGDRLSSGPLCKFNERQWACRFALTMTGSKPPPS